MKTRIFKTRNADVAYGDHSCVISCPGQYAIEINGEVVALVKGEDRGYMDPSKWYVIVWYVIVVTPRPGLAIEYAHYDRVKYAKTLREIREWVSNDPEYVLATVKRAHDRYAPKGK